MSDEVTIRAYRPGDEHGLVEGYNKMFPQPRDLQHWYWKFRDAPIGDNPVGRTQIAVADAGDAGIVGTYTSMMVRVRMEGEDLVAAQGLDMWVFPEFRRKAARPGLFVQVGLKHYEMFGGTAPGQARFHYGWPIPNWRIGQRYLRYENVRDWDFLFRQTPPDGFPERPTSDALEVVHVARFREDVDLLWDHLKDAAGLAIVRDSAYLNWRYADAHDRDYELYECRERGSGKLRGVFVFARSDFLFPGSAFIVDWLCPADDDDATTAMVAMAERRTNESRRSVLATLFPQLDARFLKFQQLGFLVYGTSYFLVVIPFDSRGTLFYREQWYHTAGDSDLL